MTTSENETRRLQARALATREALLRAGRACFIESGFAASSVTDIVGRAGTSVGNLYHHYGSKNGLYIALYEQYQARQETRAASAVQAARTAGTTEPIALFVAGARAYLDGCWEDRDLSNLFLDQDGPPGFRRVVRTRFTSWVRTNAKLLAPGDRLSHRALTLALTAITAEAGREIALQTSQRRAAAYRDEILRLIGRLGVS